MTSTITSTIRYRRLVPTFVARVGVLRLGQTIKPKFADTHVANTRLADGGMTIEAVTAATGVRKP